jgi:hypothetical protein
MLKSKEKRAEYARNYYEKNKTRFKKWHKAYRENNKDKIRVMIRNWYIKQYGLSLEQHTSMLKKQNGVCAICGNKEIWKDSKGRIKNLSIDHNHVTNEIRGLLCNRCNRLLGLINDDIKILKSTIKYLSNKRVK